MTQETEQKLVTGIDPIGARGRLSLIAQGRNVGTTYHPSTFPDPEVAFWGDVASMLAALTSSPKAEGNGLSRTIAEQTQCDIAPVDPNELQSAFDAIDRAKADPAPQPLQAPKSEGEAVNPNTSDLVDRFAAALKAKLAKAERKYGYSDDWMKADWKDELIESLAEHVFKGDPIDVAAYCAFAWHHDWSVSGGVFPSSGKNCSDAVSWTGSVDYEPSAALTSSPKAEGAQRSMRCKTCNAPRAKAPCHKCGGALTLAAEGWEEPELPPVDRIRELARQVGYGLGVHGSLERDLDLIAMPWVEDATSPAELAEHIARGLPGRIAATFYDAPHDRIGFNIKPDGWFKMIDLSVIGPHSAPQPLQGGGVTREAVAQAIRRAIGNARVSEPQSKSAADAILALISPARREGEGA